MDLFNLSSFVLKNRSIIEIQLVGKFLTLTVDAGAYRELENIARRYMYSSENQKDTNELYKSIQEDVMIRNAQLNAHYEYQLLKWRCLSKEAQENVSKPKKPCTKDIKPIFNFYLISDAEARALIKSYFLYEFLLSDLNMSGMFTVEDFQNSLKGSSAEKISCKRGATKARKILESAESILYVNSLNYKKSVKSYSSSSFYHKMEYVFHPITYRSEINSQPISLKYQLKGNLFQLVKLFYSFKCHSNSLISIDDMISTYHKHFPTVSTKTSASAAAHTTGLNPCNELNFSKEEYNENEGWVTEEDFGFKIFLPDYSDLELAPMPQKDLLGHANIEDIKKWKKYSKDKAKITTVSRLWHPFHCLPRDFRKHVCYKGQPLVEAMDVKNCYYVLMAKVLSLDARIDPNELSRFMDIVRNGDIYSEVGKSIRFVRGLPGDQGDEEYLEFIGTNRRNLVKLEMQSFRNFKTYGQAQSQHPMLARKFKELFPSICNWLFSYPTYINRQGKNTKRLQSDMSRIETMLISSVCFRLNELGLHPFSLHDAIYLPKNELETLEEDFVSNLFWEVYDTTSEEDVKRALYGATNQI